MMQQEDERTEPESTHSMVPIEIEDGGKSCSLPMSEELRTDLGGVQKKPRKFWYLVSLGCLALILLVVVIPVVAVRSSRSSSSSSQQRVKRVTSIDQYIDFLVKEDISLESVMRDNDTPQNRAIRWLAERDPANLPIPSVNSEKYRLVVRYVMVLNFYALNGRKWSVNPRFLRGEDICLWHGFDIRTGNPVGVLCRKDDKLPRYLHLWGLGLEGELPAENGKLVHMQVFNVHSNKLTGKIPEFFCDMPILEDLLLNSNGFTGEIPSCLSNLPLDFLVLRRNKLTGGFPSSLCDATTMRGLDISWNQLEGPLPTCVSKLEKLVELFMQNNEFSGTLGEDHCKMKSLRAWDMERNNFEGTFPSCFAGHDFVYLFLSDNMFTGELPAIGTTNTTLFFMDNNFLSGDPTSQFNRLTNVLRLIASNNEFVADMDQDFLADNMRLDVLDLSNNNFTSTEGFPSHLLNHPNLTIFDVSRNELTGELPEFEDNNELEFFSAYGNELSGNIPDSISKVKDLKHLDLSLNNFDGPMPTSIGLLGELRVLFLSENNFDEGVIPDEYKSLVKLSEMSLRNTNRIGELPEYISDFNKALTLLDLSANGLLGTIPESYGEKLTRLRFLLLNNNGLDGVFPTTFGESNNLRAVYLDGNDITGSVSYLCNLPHFKNGLDHNEVVAADCAGDSPEIDPCPCCTCCDADADFGCSEPLLSNLNAEWENGFRRISLNEYTFGNETHSLDLVGTDVSIV